MNTTTHRSFGMPAGKAAAVGVIGYLVILVFSLGNFVLQDLIVPGDAPTSLSNIAGSELPFRAAVAGWIVVIAADAVVAWALYLYLEPVSKAYAMLTAWFRLVFVAIAAATLVDLLSILPVVGTSGVDQIDASAASSLAAYEFGFNVAFVFFGLHILGLGYLVLKSDRIPKTVGIVLVIASAGYLIDSFASVLSSGYAGNEALFLAVVALPALVGEYSLALWLLVVGRRADGVRSAATT